jgi:hypothetical protein
MQIQRQGETQYFTTKTLSLSGQQDTDMCRGDDIDRGATAGQEQKTRDSEADGEGIQTDMLK